MTYQPRFYRQWGHSQLQSFTVSYLDTDLFICASRALPDLCFNVIRDLRRDLDGYAQDHPEFFRSLLPLQAPAKAIPAVLAMSRAASLADVGPMAAVAGYFAEQVGEAMLAEVDEVIVENGGDIFFSVKKDGVIGIYAGPDSPFSGKIGLRIAANTTPLGICTSAGTVGPSRSLGLADAVTVLSHSTPLADAVATAVGNRVKKPEDIDSGLEWGSKIPGVLGLLIIVGRRIGIWGQVDIVKTKVPSG